MRKLFSFLVPVLVVAAVSATPAPKTDPVAAGLSVDQLAKIANLLRENTDIEIGRIPGAVLAIERRGVLGFLQTFGRMGPNDDRPMRTDTIFRIHSMTKPITSLAAMMLVERGLLALDEPLAKYLPAFATITVESEAYEKTVPAAKPITIRDLLRHTAGMTYGSFGDGYARSRYRAVNIRDRNQSNAEHAAKLATLPLEHQPGTTWEYSRATDILGHVVELASGQTLDRFFADEIFGPLQMVDTGFSVPVDKHKRIVGSTASLIDMTHPFRFLSGGGGLVSTVHDYLQFCRMMLHGGELGGKRLISRETVAAMTRDQLGGIKPGKYYVPGRGYGFGYGFAVRRAEDAWIPGSPGDYWWGGKGGTYFWIDPAQDLIVVFMSQEPGERQYYRTLLRILVYEALAD
jgi:CubicO group peptidase (beta-lactamase class C family)